MFRIIFAVCLLVSSAAAQTATGVITGSVLDSTGASVAGAVGQPCPPGNEPNARADVELRRRYTNFGSSARDL